MTAAFLDMPFARAAAESLMSSTCTIRASATGPVTDPATGEVTFPAGATVYSGPCRVRPAGVAGQSGSSRANAGGAELFTYDYLVSIPFAVVTVAERCRLTVNSSPDPALVGLDVEVQKVERGDNLSARRLMCNEVT